jgi:hypothetical protein
MGWRQCAVRRGKDQIRDSIEEERSYNAEEPQPNGNFPAETRRRGGAEEEKWTQRAETFGVFTPPAEIEK